VTPLVRRSVSSSENRRREVMLRGIVSCFREATARKVSVTPSTFNVALRGATQDLSIPVSALVVNRLECTVNEDHSHVASYRM